MLLCVVWLLWPWLFNVSLWRLNHQVVVSSPSSSQRGVKANQTEADWKRDAKTKQGKQHAYERCLTWEAEEKRMMLQSSGDCWKNYKKTTDDQRNLSRASRIRKGMNGTFIENIQKQLCKHEWKSSFTLASITKSWIKFVWKKNQAQFHHSLIKVWMRNNSCKIPNDVLICWLRCSTGVLAIQM